MRDGETASERRGYARRHVIWHCELAVGEYVFDCGLLNISLSGGRIRLELPLKRGAEVLLTLKKLGPVPARVTWHREDQIGLKFGISPEEVRRRLGNSAVKSLGLDRPTRKRKK